MFAVLSCERLRFRAGALAASCDPTHAFVASRLLLIKPDCAERHSNQDTIKAFTETKIPNAAGLLLIKHTFVSRWATFLLS